ncbi:MAG: hypothetical protein Q9220_001179 [cf. Caloplaca sp. 1 TL-2023]
MQPLRNLAKHPNIKPSVLFACKPVESQYYASRFNGPLRAYSSSLRHTAIKSPSRRWISAGVIFASVLGASFFTTQTLHADSPLGNENRSSPAYLRLEDVRNHGPDADEKWITKENKVYNITDWIPGHPGGDVILRAVGGPIDQYWNIFTIHKKQEVYDILDSYYIGDVDPQDLVDGRVPVGHVDDPFKNDPKRDERLIVHSSRPCNAETPAEGLNTFITPDDLFYVRQHMWVPDVDEKGHRLVIESYDGEEKEYTLQDLKNKFKEVSITATLQCSGNRRRHMTEEARTTNGLQWDAGAISTAEWTGVRLRDVLKDAGVDIDELPEDLKHVQFVGAEAYGASIPIEKAVDRFGDVLLVYEMNGKPLALDHGYPLRLLAPGNVAARSVKWVNRIRLADEESTSQWQRRDYKCFGPNVGSNNADWDSAPAIQETPVQSAITSLRDISSHSARDSKLLQVYGLEEDSIAVEGYSFAGGGRKIIRVDVSADDGRTWHQAELLPDQSRGAKAWAWTRWRWVLPRQQAGRCFVVKAVDEAYNTQPAEYEANYNFRGNLTSSWHRVGYRAKPLPLVLLTIKEIFPATSQKRLALAVIDFLSNSLKDGTVPADEGESIEIAKSCIADTFHVDPNDQAALKDAIGDQSLLSIYGVYEKLKGKSSTAPAPGASAGTKPSNPKPSGPTPTNPEAESFKSQGNAAMQQKDYPKAIDLYTKAVSLSPTNPIYLSNRAAAYSASHKHTEACADAELAVSADPKYTKAWSRLGLARFVLGDAKGSMEAYQKGIEYEGNGGSEAMKKGFKTAKEKVDEEEKEGADVDMERAASPTRGAGGAGAGGMPDMSGLASMLGGGGGGGGGGMPDLSSMMNNPMFASMAQNLMSNPEALQGLMSNPRLRELAQGLGGGQGGGGMPDIGALMSDPSLRDMAMNMMGGGAGRGAGRGAGS